MIAILFCAGISLFGQLLMLVSFTMISAIRNGLFSRLIFYFTISGVIQERLLASYYPQFSILRIYGGLSCILWSAVFTYCIKQLFKAYVEGVEQIRQKFIYLECQERIFICLCWGIPLLCILMPLLSNSITAEESICYIFANKHESTKRQTYIDIQKTLLWELPILLYLVYSISVLIHIKSIFIGDELDTQISQLISQLLRYPIITLICTSCFTIQDFETFFYLKIPGWQNQMSISLLSLWGFCNSVAFLSQEAVQEHIRDAFSKQNNKEGTLPVDNELTDQLSIESGEDYYRSSLIQRNISTMVNEKTTY